MHQICTHLVHIYIHQIHAHKLINEYINPDKSCCLIQSQTRFNKKITTLQLYVRKANYQSCYLYHNPHL